MLIRGLFIAIVLSLAGCAGTTPPTAPPRDHPANPLATEAPLLAPSPTLAITNSPATTASDAPMDSMGAMHGGHNMSNDMPGMQHDMNQMLHPMPMNQSGDNTAHSAPTSNPATTQSAAAYTCIMHPEVISDRPGQCPKCGMTLVVKAKQGAGK